MKAKSYFTLPAASNISLIWRPCAGGVAWATSTRGYDLFRKAVGASGMSLLLLPLLLFKQAMKRWSCGEGGEKSGIYWLTAAEVQYLLDQYPVRQDVP